jgi:hypothetical protein
MVVAEKVVDALPTEIVDVDWRWSRTQYNDEQWIEPKIRTYRLRFDQGDKLDVQISCKKMRGSCRVTKDLLSITIKQPLLNQNPCNDQSMDDTYLSDIARVVDYSIDDDRLVLELDNHAGFMYFSNKL